MAVQFKREPLTGSEVTALEAACGKGEEKTLIWTLLDTGIRVSEYCDIKKELIDWQGDRMVVWGKGKKGAKKRRVVPLTERVQNALKNTLALNDSMGCSTRTAERLVKELARKAGITKKVTPHTLRHTFAVKALKDGVDLVSLKLVMGHAYLSTTEIYLNMSPEAALQAFKEKRK